MNREAASVLHQKDKKSDFLHKTSGGIFYGLQNWSGRPEYYYTGKSIIIMCFL